MRHLLAKAGCAIALCAAGPAAAEEPWREAAHRTMAEVCAMRGLALRQPVRVESMTTFQGGYTAGIGSVVWEEEYAEQWRQGWCALGAYCAPASDGDAARENQAEASSLAGPRGLYDREKNTLFVMEAHAQAAAIVAHETTHALQYQNYPGLDAIHLWHNRDLAAAAHTATEGDAHLVGWAFSAENRLHMCSMDPDHAMRNHANWRKWSPQSFWAHEGFPHVFGPEYALRRRVSGGAEAVDAMLREPPLSTLAVLRPGSPKAVAFFRLPPRLGSDETCSPGLRNTAGVVGIWGLLNQHGADGLQDDMPAFLESWRGDRFLHIACPGDADDEFAWLSAWETAEAAREFAEEYNAIAASIAEYGGVLRAPATAQVEGSRAIVTTPGLIDEAESLASAPQRSFSTFGEWIASGCFPLEDCYDSELEADEEENTFVCPADLEPSDRLDAWIERIRAARARMATIREAGPALESVTAAGRLATFCAVNSARNGDLAKACRAAYSGISYVASLLDDVRWRLLPQCTTTTELRRWLIDTYYKDLSHPLAAETAFDAIHGVTRAAGALAADGLAGLRALAAAPPLSTLELLADAPASVAMVRLPTKEIAAAGCEIAASDSQGALRIWNLLIDDGRLAGTDIPPFLLDWQGDRQFNVRCGDKEGWSWVSRWRTPAAAATFAAHIGALSKEAVAETGLPRAPHIHDGRTVWLLTPPLDPLADLLATRTEFREFDDFGAWTAAGCFPEVRCNGDLTDAAATASTPDSGAAAVPPETP